MVAEEAALSGVFDGFLETDDGQRVLGTDIDDGRGSADGIGTDEHAFDEVMGVAFDDRAVHERTGVAFVGVADEVLLIAFGILRRSPFEGGGETGAAAAAEAGDVDLLDDIVLGHAGLQDLLDGLVAVSGDVFIDVLGVDETAVTKRDTGLRFEEVGIVRSDAEAVERREVSGGDGGIDVVRILLGDLDITVEGALVIVEVHDGFEEAHAVTAGDVEDGTGRVVFFQKGVEPVIHCTGAGCESAAAFANDEFHASAPPSSFAISRRTLRHLSGVRVL